MSDEIKWTLEPDDVEWQIDWDQKRFPDKPPVEMLFEHEGALAHLLMNDVCYLNSFYYEKTWPAEAQACINVFVTCSDTYAYACADAERLPFDQIEPLYRMWKRDPTLGPTAWAVMQRKERPIAPVEKMLRDAGYDVDSWELRGNTSNAETQALFAHVAAARKAGGAP